MSDRLALANAIEDAGIERSKAARIATVIADAIHGSVATKADVQTMGDGLKAEITAVRAELRAEVAAVRADVQASEAALKAEIGTVRTELAAQSNGVRSMLAAETARIDTRIERLDGTVKAQPNAIMLRPGTLMVVVTGAIFAALRYLPLPGHGG